MAVPLIPDVIQWGRDNVKRVNEQAIKNNKLNMRSREVQGSLKECRNTGITDINGNVFVNDSDVELLDKLGFEIAGYSGLEKTSEALDLYSYIEKFAGVPKDVARLIDTGKSFSAEYLKDMGYNIPKGYEVKGDLCCPVEKTEQSFQQTEKSKKQSTEKTASTWLEKLRAMYNNSGRKKK